jgi:hypothetical protein
MEARPRERRHEREQRRGQPKQHLFHGISTKVANVRTETGTGVE